MATWNRAVETLPREELASLQLKGLRKTLRRLGRAEVSALEELARLPFSTAADCRGRTLLSRCWADRRELVELHVDPVMSLAIAATKGDLLQNAEAVARGFAMAGLEKGDAFAVLEPLSLQGDLYDSLLTVSPRQVGQRENEIQWFGYPCRQAVNGGLVKTGDLAEYCTAP